jgi:cysteine desulfurase / selenocysteine lyase
VAAHGRELGAQLVAGLRGLPGARVLGARAGRRIALASVSLPWPSMRDADVARLLAATRGILVSGGMHCAHVLHDRVALSGSLRASAQLFNDAGDVEALVAALRDLV